MQVPVYTVLISRFVVSTKSLLKRGIHFKILSTSWKHISLVHIYRTKWYTYSLRSLYCDTIIVYVDLIFTVRYYITVCDK